MTMVVKLKLAVSGGMLLAAVVLIVVLR